MQKDADYRISRSEREFILQILRDGLRVDGRQLNEYRPLKFQIAVDDSSATVLLGQTRVCAVISASIEAPHIARQNEGFLHVSVEFSPMACPTWEVGRPGERAIEISRLVERTFRETRAVDLEALCIVVGKYVWNLRVDIHVLDHCGNLVDAATLAALAALMAYRKPEVSVEGSEVTIHSPEEREPQPLTIHHYPIAVTFAFIIPNKAKNDDCLVVVDPNLQEEAALQGTFTIAANIHGEICQVQKSAGPGINFHSLMQSVQLACHTCGFLMDQVNQALKEHSVARVQARIRRHEGLLIPPELEYEEEWNLLKAEETQQQEIDIEEGMSKEKEDMEMQVETLRNDLETSLSETNKQLQQRSEPLMQSQKRQRKQRQDQSTQQDLGIQSQGSIDNEEEEEVDEETIDEEQNNQQTTEQQPLVLSRIKQRQKRKLKKLRPNNGEQQQRLQNVDMEEQLRQDYMAISQLIADSGAGAQDKSTSLADAFKSAGKSKKQKQIEKIKQKKRQS
eukprot:TRINITY_DN1941_c0_g3_i2.p1 TRINITY_DN1941_c0_g3~~TRINITY_DN1941_c0_g3_i2.p1  ORF type:complete len:507 (+),score=66.20 TRINITY_DN1941_c0_g3_i2:101-1621(+)